MTVPAVRSLPLAIVVTGLVVSGAAEGQEPPPDAVPDAAPEAEEAPPLCRATDVEVRLTRRAQVEEACAGRGGQRLVLDRGGLVIIDSEDGERTRTCVSTRAEPVEVTVGTFAEPLGIEGGTCGAEGARWDCRVGGAPVVTCGEPRAREASGATPRASMFVLDFEARGVPVDAARVLNDALTARLTERKVLAVMSGEDVRDLLDFEAQREATGCTEASCLSAVGAALGARFLLSGTVERADRAIELQVALFDVASARVLAREVAGGRSLEDLSLRLDDVARNLLAPLTGDEPSSIPPPDLGRAMLDGATLTSAGVVGGGAAAAGCCAGLLSPAAAALGGWTAFFVGALNVAVWGVYALCACPFATVPLVGAIAGVAAWIGDNLAGYPAQPARVALTGGLGAVAAALLALAAVGAGLVFGVLPAIPGFLAGTPNEDTLLLSLASVTVTIPACSMLAGGLAGAAAAATYVASVGLFDDGPPLSATTTAAAEVPAPPAPTSVAQAY